MKEKNKKMAAKTYYLSGEAQWAKLYESNLDEWEGERFASIELIIDDKMKEFFKNTGSKLKLRTDDRGRSMVRFRRPYVHAKYPEYGGLPEVVDADGNPFDKLIGNGSKVTLRIVVYDAGKMVGTRLEKVRVDELVVYESTGGGSQRPMETPDDFEGVPF